MKSGKSPRRLLRRSLSLVLSACALCSASIAAAQIGPTLLTPDLGVRTVASQLVTPIGIAFLGPNDFLVAEKNTGRVVRVTNGISQGPVLDLGVNFLSERGLLGIALHPDFPATPQVFLFWTARSTGVPANPFFPDERVGLLSNMFAPDTDDTLTVPLLGNRVDRFTWDGTSLSFDRNLIHLRAFQHDAAPEPPGQGDQAQPARGNHDGGVIAFGPDEKLYVLFGDQGRRGQLQNLPSGPTATGLGPVAPDDQFGGPEPDDAHLAGVILRLETDGTAPPDNPFFDVGAGIGGEVGANIQKIFAYGLRNSFGMAFDPLSGRLWEADNGEDAFDEINRIDPGMNGGWIQVQGPLSRLEQYREIETTSLHHETFPNLQQFRWGPENIALSGHEARQRLFMLPGAVYRDPQLSFKHVVPPAGLGFVEGVGLGPEFEGEMFLGSADLDPLGGILMRVGLNKPRTRIRVDDKRLRDQVVDNVTFHETTEVESLLIGQNFGIVTDIETGPNGNLFVVSLTGGAIYEIFRNPPSTASAFQRGDVRHVSQALSASSPVQPGKAGEIRYAVQARGHVDLAIFDVQGRRVATLVREELEAGEHTRAWDGKDRSGRAVASGVYFVRLRVTGASGTQADHSSKVTVLR